MMEGGYFMGVPIGLIAEISLMSPSAISEMMKMATEAAERREYERLKEKYEG